MEKEVALSLAIIHHFSMVNNDVGKQAYTVFRHMGNPSKLHYWKYGSPSQSKPYVVGSKSSQGTKSATEGVGGEDD